ncbi:nitroreductase/quinone reductase family protein [Prauserella endophytica]|uniref:Nitroreductase family deazaflavin-dependent oxidoreductase n=1 Tax=Prauserella endophytica TaxID=1592324 RepID=A0ABY2S7E4_9PSEU|nr:nitroreductase/quinone reductase family protein [Prauserella endophytica]TKG71628.1 nitroreductase family deazaflavin-dependent oxidoreductase [Prauserella endophytica]
MPAHPNAPAKVAPFNQAVVDEFRANGGRVGGPFEGGGLLLLTTVGARSGQQTTSPLAYLRVDGELVIVGSAGGGPRNPAWYHNLLAHPAVRVELGTETFDAIAVPAEGAERQRLFEQVVAREPGFGDYQARTARELPVVVLQRARWTTEPAEVTTLAAKLVEIHTWLRAQLAELRAQADEYFAQPAGRPPGLSLRLRQHCLAFCEGLHFHHGGEEAVLLPNLEREYPHLREAIARLRAEHGTVSRIREELEKLLADITSTGPARFRAELERMSAELNSHLDYEEEQLLPVLESVPFPPV